MSSVGTEGRSIPPSLESWAKDPAIMGFIQRVLDRRDRKGHFPKSLTYKADRSSIHSLGKFLPPAALRARSDHRVSISLSAVQDVLAREAQDAGRAVPDLEAIFDALAGREPRNRLEEEESWTAEGRERIRDGVEEGKRRARRAGAAGEDDGLDELVARLLEPTSLEHRRLLQLARRSDFPALREAVARLVAAFVLVRAPRPGALRLDHLSLAAGGSTKVLRPDSEDYGRLADALLAIDGDRIVEGGETRRFSKPLVRRLLLEEYGIVPNETPLEVLVQGPLCLRMEGEELRDIERLARKGLPSKLTYGVLRASEPSLDPGVRILSVENESAFHVLARHRPEDLVVFTAGQPAWPVVLLLRKLAATEPQPAFLHTGDMDRSGLLILRALREKTGANVEPVWMDAATFEACRDLSMPMTREEQERTARLLERWEEPFGKELLKELSDSGRWLEQEAVLQRVLGLG